MAKSRAFFFADYEGFRELQKLPMFASLPSVDDRRGVFSVPVRNPLTGEIFPANTPIPAAKMTPFAVKVLSDLPAPTGPGRGSNWLTLRRDKNYNDKFVLKLDGQINSKMSGSCASASARATTCKGRSFQVPPAATETVTFAL
jgi:hypothetical protein